MNHIDTANLLDKIKKLYPQFQINESVIEIWTESLQKIKMRDALSAVKKFYQTETGKISLAAINAILESRKQTHAEQKPMTVEEQEKYFQSRGIRVARQGYRIDPRDGALERIDGKDDRESSKFQLEFAMDVLGSELVSNSLREITGPEGNFAALVSRRDWVPRVHQEIKTLFDLACGKRGSV